jgi:hypothetical protein
MHCPWLRCSSRFEPAPPYHGAGTVEERGTGRSRTGKVATTAAFGIVLALTAPSVSSAANFLDGAYGSKDGCIYAKTGQSSGADDFLLLNDDGITTSVSTCDFQGEAKKTATGFTIQAECEADGEAGSLDTATLTKSAKGYTVTFPDGTKLGPVPKCP